MKSLQSISSWQTTIPLGIPTDRVGFNAAPVKGALGGDGVILNDNTGIGSAVLWQHSENNTKSQSESQGQSQSVSLGVGGVGLKATDLQAVAASLH